MIVTTVKAAIALMHEPEIEKASKEMEVSDE